jgi:hypothetical protein
MRRKFLVFGCVMARGFLMNVMDQAGWLACRNGGFGVQGAGGIWLSGWGFR